MFSALVSTRLHVALNCPKLNFPPKIVRTDVKSHQHAHTSLTTAENLSKSSSTILAWDHVRDHAHFRHDAFFRAFGQVASHTAIKGVVAALETTPEAHKHFSRASGHKKAENGQRLTRKTAIAQSSLTPHLRCFPTHPAAISSK